MWFVQRQNLKNGFYYSAVFRRVGGPVRTVTLKEIESSPLPMSLAARLRRWDPRGEWDDDTVRRVVRASDDDAAARVVILRPAHAEKREFERLKDDDPRVRNVLASMQAGLLMSPDLYRLQAPLRLADSVVEMADAVVAFAQPPDGAMESVRQTAEAKPPIHPSGAMTLRRYVDDVWAPLRMQQKETWRRERGWWDRHLLPALGEMRLCDLTRDRWSTTLDGLTKCCGRSKAIAQNAYRTALTRAFELGWIAEVHSFSTIIGSTKRATAEVEPLSMPEVRRFLDAVAVPRDRAFFALQFGQGLRPGEVMGVDWGDFDWTNRTIRIRGTKNSLANGVVALTPLSRGELVQWWTACGQPAHGPAFPSSRPGRRGKLMSTYPRRSFKAAAAASGLNDKRKRALIPYAARHSFATIAAITGVPRAATKRMMRHATTSTILEQAYERASLEQTATAFEGFGAAGE